MDDDWGAAPRAEADGVCLRDVLKPRKTTIDYLYDFGDAWEHRLAVTGIRQGEPGVPYPRYIGGEWAGPPEDSGGIPGFYNMLDARADPEHPSHAEITQWLNDYDPKLIDEVSLKASRLPSFSDSTEHLCEDRLAGQHLPELFDQRP